MSNTNPAVGSGLPNRIVFGAYMPRPWDLKGERNHRAMPNRMWSAYSAPHTLFQLLPCLEILYPEYDAQIKDLISIVNTGEKQDGKGELNLGEPGSTGLSVDFDTGTATMRSKPTAIDDPFLSETEVEEKQCDSPNNTYYDIGREHNISTGAWETTMRIQKFEIFEVGGQWSKDLDSIESTNLQSQFPSRFHKEDPRRKRLAEEVERRAAAAWTARMQEPKVSNDVLKERIKGFGPESAKN